MTAPTPPPVVSTVFGCLIGGRPVSTSFAEIVPNSRYTCAVPAPASAAHVSIFLLPGVPFPADRGITVMWAVAPYTEWTPLGVLTPSAPSATFRTGWPSALAPPAPQPPPESALLGLAVEPLDAVASVAGALASAEFDQLAIAQLVARDLYAFVGSFCTATPGGERVVMPMAAVDGWLQKFMAKFRHDPAFLQKRSSL